MKKLIMIISALALTSVLAFASPEATKALKAYENAVVAMEKAAKDNNVTSLINAQLKAVEASKALEKVKSELTILEAAKFSKLSLRYAEAAKKVSNQTSTMNFGF